MALIEGRYYSGSMSDKRYEADGLAEYCRRFLDSGVWEQGTNLMVSPGIGMNVNVNYGAALINGYPFKIKNNGSDTLSLPISEPDAQPRIDRVIIRNDAVQKKVEIYIKKGTPASNPSAPTIERTQNVFEISLAKVLINPGTQNISAASITDERADSSVCGLAGVSGAADIDRIYPVGSIYISVSSVSPAVSIGGSWELFSKGKFLVGFNDTDTDFNASGKTGGEKAHTLTINEMPGHSHTQNAHAHSISHDHGAVNTGYVSHDHSHWFNVNTGGESGHVHQACSGSYKVGSGSGSSYYYFTNNGGTNPHNTGGSSGHYHNVQGSTGGISQNHYHGVDLPNYAGNSSSDTAVNQNTGGGASHNNLPPYTVAYMWKRIA